MQHDSLNIDSLPYNVAIYEKDGDDFIIRGFNKTAEITEDVSQHAILGKKLTNVFPTIKKLGLYDVLLRVEASGDSEVLDTDFYENERIHSWRHNKVIKLKNGMIVTFYEDLTLVKELKEKLSKSESHLVHQRKVLRHIMNASEFISVQGYNEKHEVIYWNKASEVLYGYSKEEAYGQTLETLIIPLSLRKQVSTAINNWIQNGENIPSAQITLIDKNGNDIHVFSQHFMIKLDDGQYQMYCVDINLGEINILQKELLTQKNFLQTIINVIPDLIWLKDTEGKYLACNTMVERFYGAKESEILGKYDFDFVDAKIAQSFKKKDQIALEKGGFLINEELLTFTDGSYSGLFEIIKTPMKDGEGNVIGILGIARDITQRKLKEEQLIRYANYDRLTGLANRTLFMDRLSHLMSKRKSDKYYSALLFIDLDHFKSINDTFSHSTGDEILKVISKSLQSVVRKEDTLSRHGGDEFTILLESLDTPLDAARIAEKTLKKLQVPITIENHTFYVTASIGITIAPNDSSDPETLLRYSDIAMYEAKAAGRNQFAFYTHELSKQANDRVIIESDLRTAVENNEFELYYQPQINAETKKIIGAEALIRWIHPEKGMILPLKFIPIAESSGQILEIGKWVIQQAMKDMKKWKDDDRDISIISINLSVRQLNDNGLITIIKDSLEATECDPSWIEFEITEGYAMSDHQTATSLLEEIHELGCKLSIDDFGTGYSSLAYLKRLPIQKLKIDQSFVQDIPGNVDDEAIVSAVILIAKSLNLSVIAEGVETELQQSFLLEHDCYLAQGYLYSKPIPKAEFENFLAFTPQFHNIALYDI